jgi:outer membrane lipoprotein carrier protein
MKNKLIITFLILTAKLVLCQAQQNDKVAQDILNGVTGKYKSFRSVKANFTITVENPADKSKDVREGTIYLKGNKYKLEIAGQDIISDGKTRWTYVKDANEIQIDNQKNDENTITPSNIFTMYEKGWIYKSTGETKENGVVCQLIELVPVDPKKKNIFKVKLSINKIDKFISSAKMYDRSGKIQTISVEKFIPNGIDDDSVFSFNSGKYPGAEIIDLR